MVKYYKRWTPRTTFEYKERPQEGASIEAIEEMIGYLCSVLAELRTSKNRKSQLRFLIVNKELCLYEAKKFRAIGNYPMALQYMKKYRSLGKGRYGWKGETNLDERLPNLDKIDFASQPTYSDVANAKDIRECLRNRYAVSPLVFLGLGHASFNEAYQNKEHLPLLEAYRKYHQF